MKTVYEPSKKQTKTFHRFPMTLCMYKVQYLIVASLQVIKNLWIVISKIIKKFVF